MYETMNQNLTTYSAGSRHYGSRKTFRIYSKTRFGIFVSLMMIFLMLIAFIAGGFIFGQEATGMEEIRYENVTVEPGDTVWGIATNYVSNDQDIRDYVKAILKANNLKAGELYPNQILRIPV
jgi:cell division protein YceG involved in septum cleavage